MGEKDDVLGLSLSLSLGGCPPLKVNHMQKPSQSVPTNNKSSWNDLFQLPGTMFLSILSFLIYFWFLDSSELFFFFCLFSHQAITIFSFYHFSKHSIFF